MSVEVAPVSSRLEMREFIELPFRLHSNEEAWIPPIRIERWHFLDRRTGAFYKRGEAELFLARREGRVVGRISAQVDPAYNEFHEDATGMFGFLELEDDVGVLRALLDAAAGWLRERGRDRMIGPMDFWSARGGTRPTTSGCARRPGSRRRSTRSCGRSTSRGATR